jgi:Protein of unknown function (DUF3617)
MRFALVFAVTALATSVASAQDYPKLKAGQWEMTTLGGAPGAPPGQGSTKSTMCTDEALQKEMITMGAGMRKDMCTKNEFKRDGSKITTSSECTIGGSKVSSRAVMTLAGDTGYKTQITSSFDPPFMGMKDSVTTLEGKYVGPCGNGMVPGDFITPSGQKINIKGIAMGKPPMPPAQPARPAKAPQ